MVAVSETTHAEIMFWARRPRRGGWVPLVKAVLARCIRRQGALRAPHLKTPLAKLNPGSALPSSAASSVSISTRCQPKGWSFEVTTHSEMLSKQVHYLAYSIAAGQVCVQLDLRWNHCM